MSTTELFGGSNSSSTPVNMTPEAFKNLQGPFAAVLRQLLSGGKSMSGIPTYKGPLSAKITPNEQELLDQMQASATSGVGADARGLLRDTLAGKFLPGQPGANPFLDAAIQQAQRATRQGLEETLTRSLPGRFTSAGQFVTPNGSSAFDRAAAIATRGASDALGDIATRMSYQGYESERGRQQEAIPLTFQETESMVQNLQAQALPRLIQEFGIERGLELFNTRVQTLLSVLGITQGSTAPTIANKGEASGREGIIPGLTNAFSSLFPRGF